MEIFRNYLRNENKRPLTMEDHWSKVVTRWADSLDLPPVKSLQSLTDGKDRLYCFYLYLQCFSSAGKFLAAFATKYLPWNFVSESTPHTWKQLAERFREELPSLVVNVDEAQRGHEVNLAPHQFGTGRLKPGV